MAKTYRGGVPFKREYNAPKEYESTVPKRILLTLKHAAPCLVNEGDTVNKYSKIFEENEGFPAVFTGVGGRVEKIYRISNRVDVSVLSDKDADTEEPFPSPIKKLADMTHDELESLLLQRGISPVKLGKRECRALTVDCGGSNYNDSRLFITRSFPDKVIGGAKIIMKLIGARRCCFAIPNSDLKAAQSIESRLPSKSKLFKIVLTKDKFPTCLPNLTVSALYNIEVSAAKDIVDAGYPVVSPLLCLAYYRALVEGIPFCEGFLTVNDSDGKMNMLSLPFGTELSSLLSPKENETLLRAERLYGKEVGTSVMKASIEAITVSARSDYAEVLGRCIGCRKCMEICPARLSPTDIFKTLRKGKEGPSLVLSTAGCFECRSCSYICPSHLPLAQTIIKFRRDSGLISVDITGDDPDFYEEEPKEAEGSEDKEESK